MTQAFNPFLPLEEYIPDGEPHVFGDRVYLYGSHDKENGSTFCMLDYVVYSAPVNNLKDWRCEGVSYTAKQDPLYSKNNKYLYAPDVVKGNDGKYYLYYCMSGRDGKNGYSNPISVAVSDNPAGKFEYLGTVKDADGVPYKKHLMFDPAVINDDGIIRLYTGTRFPFHDMPLGAEQKAWVNDFLGKMFVGQNLTLDELIEKDGAYTCTLSDDMMTITSEMKRITPAYSKGTSWEKHPFFEASSIRKINGKYYFIYSSALAHELCYAVSDYPDKDFECKGTIVSNGDIGFEGREENDKVAFTGNNHGSIENINGQWYVFYHRHTHATSFSRQACAEKIEILSDGSIPQVRMTSCGLNGGALKAEGSYPSPIACVLVNDNIKQAGCNKFRKYIPKIVNGKDERYIAGISNGTTVGYRSFDFEDDVTIVLTVCGTVKGELVFFDDNEEWGSQKIEFDTLSWGKVSVPCLLRGIHSLYITFKGKGRFDLLSIDFVKTDR